jgi:death-on-curing protein
LFDLAASLCHGVCKNHPFLDGNKRTALLAARAFLFLNGLAFEPREVDEYWMMMGIDSSDIAEIWSIRWFRQASVPLRHAR